MTSTSSFPLASTGTPTISKRFIGAVEDEWQLYSDCASDYIIGSPIGFGASSIVYAATYQPRAPISSAPASPSISCALKVLDLDALPPRSLCLLQRETTLMSLSKHPNVLRVRGSWMDGHKLHIALRLMSKGSAADVMRYGWPGGMEEDVVRCILRQALQGLNYLHINEFIHRDVKAANLLIDDDGTVLLGDLGVAANLAEDTSQLLSLTSPSMITSPALLSQSHVQRTDATHGSENSNGHNISKRVVSIDHMVPAAERPRMGKRKSFVGTPCWMAPELIQGRQYDSSADIWSFGITALELTQGRPPRSRDTPQRVLLRTIQDDPPALDRNGGTYKYSRAFKEMVDSCLVKDPSKRPTAQQLLQTPFFKASKKKSYLVDAILKDLPPLTQRQERRIAHHPQTFPSVDSWDFSTTLQSATTNLYWRRGLEGTGLSTEVEASETNDGVFDMEDEVQSGSAERGSHERLQWKAVTWANKPRAFEVGENSEPNSSPSPSSPSTSDSHASMGLSPAFPAVSISSPASSVVHSTPPEVQARNIPIGTSPKKAPLKVSPSIGSKYPSPRLFTPASLPGVALLASSHTQQGLWRKIKSNVRHPSSRGDVSVGGQEAREDESEISDRMGRSWISNLPTSSGKYRISKTGSASS